MLSTVAKSNLGGESMTKHLILIGLLTLVASPVLAAEYYVIKIQPSGTCKIIDQKPNNPNDTIVGKSPYATRDEAKKAKKTAAECQTTGKSN
jgi:hypothetical protein